MNTPAWLSALIDLGLVTGLLEPDDIELIESCFASKGRRVGRILSSAPNRYNNPRKYAAWAAIMTTVCPTRVAVFSLIDLDSENKRVFERIDNWTRLEHVTLGLNVYGQNPFEFNLFAMNAADPNPPDVFAGAVQLGIDVYLARRAYA